MQLRLRTWVLALAAAAGVGCGGSNSPEGLAKNLSSALTRGDLDAADALLSSRNAPGDQQTAYISLVEDCSNGNVCSVAAVPLSDEFKKQLASMRDQYGRDVAGIPEGLIAVQDKFSDKDGGTTQSVNLPYGKVDGEYRILVGTYTAAKLTELRAKSAQAVAHEMLATGVDDDPAWESKATALPPDGGEPGKALSDHVAATTTAFKAKDYASLIALGGTRGKFLYREKDNNGTPVPAKKRELILRGQAVHELADVHIVGGYQQGDTAAVVFEGHDGAGWLVRGAYLMKLENGKWAAKYPRVEQLPPA